MSRQTPNKPMVSAAVRSLCQDPHGRVFLQWLLCKECDVEMPMLAATFEHDESRRELGRKIRAFIAENYSRSMIVDIEEEIHG